jgi:hypothetical protein
MTSTVFILSKQDGAESRVESPRGQRLCGINSAVQAHTENRAAQVNREDLTMLQDTRDEKSLFELCTCTPATAATYMPYLPSIIEHACVRVPNHSVLSGM